MWISVLQGPLVWAASAPAQTELPVLWLGHSKWNSQHFPGWLHWSDGHSPVWVAPVRLRCVLAFGWWHLDLSPCLSASRYCACRCQSLLPGADRHAGTCACSLSRQTRKDWVDPTSSVWLDAHFSSAAFLVLAHCFICVSGHVAPAWSLHFLGFLKALLNVSPDLSFSHSDVCSCILPSGHHSFLVSLLFVL